MTLMEIYNLIKEERVTLAQAAITLGISEKSLKIRMSKHGERLPLVLETLDKINADLITRDQATEALGVTVRTVNALMNSWQVTRPLKDYLIERATSTVKWEIRKKFATDYIGEHLTIEDAAEAAGVSTRQMRRWVSEMLIKHFGMPFKDLTPLPLYKRRQMAKEIEEKEGLEKAKQAVIDDIAAGKKALGEEALDRVLERRRRRARSNRNVRSG